MKPSELPFRVDPPFSLRRHVLRMTHDEGRAVARAFYAELFSRQPTIRAHFAGLDVDEQATKLWSVLRLAVARCDDQAQATEAIGRASRTHAGRRIRERDYAVFIDTLADVLAHSQRIVTAAEARLFWLEELSTLKVLIAGG